MKIYTKTGDKGYTSLFSGKRVLKSAERVDAYGTVDELNSLLGVAVAQFGGRQKKLKQELELIQHDLFAIGAALANPANTSLDGLEGRVMTFERLIDTMTAKLPSLRNFILPGGSIIGAQLHQARTVGRRVERRLVGLAQQEEVDLGIIRYFNRLSDLLFTMARFVNQAEKKQETKWVKK